LAAVLKRIGEAFDPLPVVKLARACDGRILGEEKREGIEPFRNRPLIGVGLLGGVLVAR
jgi:hypothetical protein